MGKKCQICKKKCSGDILKADGEKYFHIECFKCKACGDSLTETGFYTTTDGSYLCPTHYRTISTPLSIRADQPKSRDFSPGPVSPTVCAACGDHLHSGQVLLALNQSWHVWCFKCSECDTVLQGEYMAHENKPLCLRDYNLKYGVRCYECEKFIAGRVLQAGGYKFHPTCARCSRCGNHFGDGQEMFVQGNDIWHPQCENFPTENLALTKSPSKMSQPKYQAHLGQHLTYMYMLPEAEQTYLKQPISPHPPLPAQFHTPQAPIKIRKSRLATLKTGMQRLTEDMDKAATPRAKSPHMDNEEPIELAHFPGAHEPDPNEVPPIEREDFPAPPYPYAVEELKRRLSSSSVENDDEEDDYGDQVKVDEEKIKRNVRALDQYDKMSSIAHVLKQNIEESQKKQRLPLHWDPRNASRTPSARKMPHLRFRYDTPINASPSRHLNRPKPWAYWPDGQDRAATTVLPCFHLPQGGTFGGRAATLPDGYYYAGMDTTLSSHFSDISLNTSFTMPMNDSNLRSGDLRTNLRTSLPDLNKPVKTYPLEQLQTNNKKLPEDVDRQHLERHLTREQFEELFEMAPIEFYKLPEWKRINLKRKFKLF
ncbi:Zinc finger, LIM-type domain and Villin headpiece domain-containing protein [Aphelenchoides besseyi]|nr:Zinc finger, LIM-type domain and Villin headpiece domain-containing protein [Aphelenchoides besseyi]